MLLRKLYSSSDFFLKKVIDIVNFYRANYSNRNIIKDIYKYYIARKVGQNEK